MPEQGFRNLAGRLTRAALAARSPWARSPGISTVKAGMGSAGSSSAATALPAAWVNASLSCCSAWFTTFDMRDSLLI